MMLIYTLEIMRECMLIIINEKGLELYLYSTSFDHIFILYMYVLVTNFNLQESLDKLHLYAPIPFHMAIKTFKTYQISKLNIAGADLGEALGLIHSIAKIYLCAPFPIPFSRIIEFNKHMRILFKTISITMSFYLRSSLAWQNLS